ncbi:Putative dihydropyrimidine dehydrogenase [NADP+], similar to dihydroorotate dehydrogenase [Olavius algarvensis associated proteobacterium Delta 3]|nr:Putative dihydropyrimidine dehydrogenase [NADP+], similar to dihydroorotate dehydrogenase [Olavius algarvensis associated proteobacterium Delta 3]
MDLSTTYMGIPIKNPIIAGSSGLTGSVEKVKTLESCGAGAVVLKSIFQEEIMYEYADFMKTAKEQHGAPQYFDYDGRKNPIEYYDYVIREKNLQKYITLIEECKKTVSIPVMASINCFFHSADWLSFATHLESAGADALELNMFFPPTDFKHTREAKEALYFEIVDKITQAVSIPVALKISPYFTDLGPMIQRLSNTDIKGLVLFNRFFSPDFDIHIMEVKPSFVFSTPSDLAMSLRWIAVMAEKVACDLAASTGVHDGTAVIKQLLAGADAVQVVSSLYKNGPEYLKEMLGDLEKWMAKKKFRRLSNFKGKMSQDKSTDPAIYERAQFMRYFGGKKNVTL